VLDFWRVDWRDWNQAVKLVDEKVLPMDVLMVSY